MYFFQLSDQLVLKFSGNKNIVGSYACLTGICDFGPEQPPPSSLEITFRINDDRGFASSRVMGVRCFAAASITIFPTRSEPV